MHAQLPRQDSSLLLRPSGDECVHGPPVPRPGEPCAPVAMQTHEPPHMQAPYEPSPCMGSAPQLKTVLRRL